MTGACGSRSDASAAPPPLPAPSAPRRPDALQPLAINAIAAHTATSDERPPSPIDTSYVRCGLATQYPPMPSLASSARMDYPVETFTDAERALLAPHFTNIDRP